MKYLSVYSKMFYKINFTAKHLYRQGFDNKTIFSFYKQNKTSLFQKRY
jgi:hypothetical protein